MLLNVCLNMHDNISPCTDTPYSFYLYTMQHVFMIPCTKDPAPHNMQFIKFFYFLQILSILYYVSWRTSHVLLKIAPRRITTSGNRPFWILTPTLILHVIPSEPGMGFQILSDWGCKNKGKYFVRASQM